MVKVAQKTPALGRTRVWFNAWFWATWQQAKGGTKEAYEFDDNISKQLCICSCSDRGANAGQHFPAPY